MTVLLPMVKLELSSKNLNFGKLASVTMHMTASQYLKYFSDETNLMIEKAKSEVPDYTCSKVTKREKNF